MRMSGLVSGGRAGLALQRGLSITPALASASLNLIHGGALQLAVLDTIGRTVPGITYSTSTPTLVDPNCFGISGLCHGLAESGTAYVFANRAGYLPALITITLQGGLVLDLDPSVLGLANAASLSSWTDSVGSIAWGIGAAAPTMVDAAHGVNGMPGVQFDGATQSLVTSANVAALNPTTYTDTFALVCTSTGGQLIGGNVTPNSGYFHLVQTALVKSAVDNGGHVFSGDAGGLTSGVAARVVGQYDGTNVTSYKNGVAGTGAAASLVRNTTGVQRIGASAPASGNWWGGTVYRRKFYSPVLTSGQLAQVDLYHQKLLGQ